MSIVADLTARLEANARGELADEFGEVGAAVLRTINTSDLTPEAEQFVCRLLLLHAARCLRREAEEGRELYDGERWRVFADMLPEFMFTRATDAARALVHSREAGI